MVFSNLVVIDSIEFKIYQQSATKTGKKTPGNICKVIFSNKAELINSLALCNNSELLLLLNMF